MYKDKWTQPLPMGSKIYSKVHDNPRAFFNSSSPIILEPLVHGFGNWSLPREDCIMLWPFEFLESFRYSILRVSICDAPESDIQLKSYDHLNFSRASVLQYRASPYIMRLNRTSMWQVMTIWISRELSLFNFECLHIVCTWIGLPFEKLWPFEFLESFRSSISSF